MLKHIQWAALIMCTYGVVCIMFLIGHNIVAYTHKNDK